MTIIIILSNNPTTCPLDPIPSHLLQTISPADVPVLTHIINTSLHTGLFPSAFRQARITPLLKKPTLNLSLLKNYRLVSLLPFIAKTLERVVFNQVSAFLTQNNLLDNHQILLSTLLAKGISGTALQWFESYLSDRSFNSIQFNSIQFNSSLFV